MIITVRATASGAPLISRALATARSLIRAEKPCSMSDIAPMIAMTESLVNTKTGGTTNAAQVAVFAV